MMNSPFAIDAAKSLVKRSEIAEESEPQKDRAALRSHLQSLTDRG